MRSVVVSLVFIVTSSFAQFDQRSGQLPLDTLAKVGSHIISAEDFLERFELMPWQNKEQASRIEFSKLDFLYSMVAEKVLSMEASAQNIGSDSISLSLQRNLEKTFVRDELYKQEIYPNIMISDSELRQGMLRFPHEIEVQVLGVLTKQEGETLKKKVSQSRNKNSTLKYFNDSLYVLLDTLRVTFGFADKKIEDAVFSIGKDSISAPVTTDSYRLVMFRLLHKYPHAQNVKFSHPDRLHKVTNIIKQRKEDSLALKAFANVTASQTAEADPNVFYPLADSVISILRSDSMSYRTNNMYKFPSPAIDILKTKFAASLSQQFITIASGNMTLGDVLIGLTNNNVLFPSLNPEHIRVVLNNNIKTVIQNEMLSREGLKKNLQQSKKVRHDVATWMDSRKSWQLARAVIDTVRVSDEEIEAEYLRRPQQYGATVMVRLREILIDSLHRGKELRDRLNRKEDFPTLAKKYSLRKSWATNGGDSPWINVNDYGELGLFSSSAVVGDLNGPLKTKEGYSIFSVLERRILDDSIKGNFANTKRTISEKLLNTKQQHTLDKYIGTLAKKYNVTFSESSLRKVKTTTTNMVTWRNIGFGGRMMAVPQMIPQTQWVYEWMKEMQLNQ